MAEDAEKLANRMGGLGALAITDLCQRVEALEGGGGEGGSGGGGGPYDSTDTLMFTWGDDTDVQPAKGELKMVNFYMDPNNYQTSYTLYASDVTVGGQQAGGVLGISPDDRVIVWNPDNLVETIAGFAASSAEWHDDGQGGSWYSIDVKQGGWPQEGLVGQRVAFTVDLRQRVALLEQAVVELTRKVVNISTPLKITSASTGARTTTLNIEGVVNTASVDWADGETSTIEAVYPFNIVNVQHTYSAAGTYRVEVSMYDTNGVAVKDNQLIGVA